MMATLVDDSDCGHSVQGLVVISSAQNTTNKQLIQKILKQFNQRNGCEEFEPKWLTFGTDAHIDGFDLKIDNKYYSANIFLFDIRDKDLFSDSFIDSVNGVILYFDANEESSFVGVESWLSYLNRFDNQIKLLICQTIDETKRGVIDKWCLDNSFELVELCPQTKPNDHHFEDFDAMTRIFHSIQAYHWPHSTLKEAPKYKPSHHFKSLIEKEISNTDHNSQQVEQKEEDLSDQLKDMEQIEDNENFNHLFEKFSEMKVKSSQMNETERKDYAERVTIAFWKAIGGDINEIEGLEENDVSNQ